jgi:hypothetical protein
VFDTAGGFAAVWHLNGNADDATAGRHNGTDYGTAASPGIIGAARKFDGTDSIRVPGLLGTPSSVTLSAWIKVDTTKPYAQEVISIGDAVAIRADELSNNGTTGFYCTSVSPPDTIFTFVSSGEFIAKSGWRHVALTIDNARQVQSFYLDATPVRTVSDTNQIVYAGVGPNTLIGKHGNLKTSYQFFGSIDEPRVCTVARSADWIRLSYMNQKSEDKLVVFK